MSKIKRALISVSDKEGLAAFAKGLVNLGVEILSTGGTARYLSDQGIRVREVSDFTGFPEILDGRVKTLHPKVHGGILGRRNYPSHQKQMKQHGIEPIDLVVVNLYPFEGTISKAGCMLEEAVEQIDIGGPAMIRSAAKNFHDVAVIVDPEDYPRILKELGRYQGALSPETRMRLATKAFTHTARYDGIISRYLETRLSPETPVLFPQILDLKFEKIQNLRYGENPHQLAAFYRDLPAARLPDGQGQVASTADPADLIAEPSVSKARQLHGKEMSFNNFLDANSALELVKEFSEPTAVVVKHNNPCGVASAESLPEAYRVAKATDPVSAFGGVAAFNRHVDSETAREITSTFMEVVIAPAFDEEALGILCKKKDLRLLETGPMLNNQPRAGTMDFRRVVGGLLLQERDLGRIEDIRQMRVVTTRRPTEEEFQGLAFSWKVAKHVKSNAIVFARAGQTIGIGAGQMSRVDSVRLAAQKAVLPLAGCVMASDAFFPFRDGLDEAAKSGVKAVIQPGGSIRDEEVIKAANEHEMAMVFTGMRHFRH
jgi:phosphoribosylaminoimidazolecarboxamide formyltransferase / IMP cyclohydrolase